MASKEAPLFWREARERLYRSVRVGGGVAVGLGRASIGLRGSRACAGRASEQSFGGTGVACSGCFCGRGAEKDHRLFRSADFNF